MNLQAGKIRAVAICICRQAGRILVFEGYDSVKEEHFHRPLGGTIEFGEMGSETVRREFLEEIGTDLQGVEYLGMLENIFTCDGKPGHEIVLVYDGQLADTRLYQKETFAGNELGTPFKALWVRIDEAGPGQTPLYPDGLLELIREKRTN